MKSMLIIGMGKFGHHLCDNLLALGNDVMIVDIEEEKVSDMLYKVTNVQIGDCTERDVVSSIGVGNFDIVFVCIGENFQNSLEVTDLVKSMGAKHVISKATREVHAKFLLKNGADEVIYPDRDIAERLAKRVSIDNVFDYIELNREYSFYEIKPPAKWIGHSLKELDVRRQYGVNVVGIKQHGKINILTDPDHKMNGEDHLMIIGAKENMERILKQKK